MANKKIGVKASAQDNFIGPNCPTGVTASNVGTNRAYNDGAITISWTAPTTGNTPIGYKVYNGASLLATVAYGTNSITVGGLLSNTSYTLTVKSYDAYAECAGVNANAVTVTTVPQAPTIGTATNTGSGRPYNNGAATITYTAGADGGSSVTTFTATASAGGYTATGTSPITVTGLQSNTAYTFTVTATNANGTSTASSASNSITATTVPNTPGAPSVSTVAIGGSAAQGSANTATDTVSWSAPADGGSGITNYYWACSDGKTGNTTSTSVAVSQESGTAQTYTVRADNANGSSGTSSASASITSAFSFTPFSVFGFSPFAVFGFSPFGFSPFGFSPFGFSPFGFSPFAVFSFSPFGFSPFSPYFKGSLSPSTKIVMADGTIKESTDIVVGDQLKSAIIPGLSNQATTTDIENWVGTEDFSSLEITTTTVIDIVSHTAPIYVNINGDGFSGSHLLLIKRDGQAIMRYAEDLKETDLIWSSETNTWSEITSYEKLDYPNEVITISCEPYDIFFTEKSLTHDGYQG